ncbi:MAG: MBL fold metallo-hydrolase [Promethearchaeota archaeon]|nr:MAG: MBL fold metallo-hydrolase [Candidatus Lokiarchaeota archaeon]
MIELEIEIITNNIVIPFQQFHKEHNLEFIEFNKLFATQSIAEHGLGFLIKVFEIEDSSQPENKTLINKLIFDTGGQNSTFIHNLSVRGYQMYDVDAIILSHWHYDHNGGLYDILTEIDHKVPIYTHEAANYERFFRRSADVSLEDLKQKHREEIIPLLNQMKIVNQEPLDFDEISKLNGEIKFIENKVDLLDKDSFKVICAGEIPRNYLDEDFSDYFAIMEEDILEVDKILDDKCLFFEFKDRIIMLNGCCHSGLKNTVDYVQSISNKPISHIIGGFHMASASDERIKTTVEYVKNLDLFKEKLFLFPIHCTGDKFLREVNRNTDETIQAFDASVGTKFVFKG